MPWITNQTGLRRFRWWLLAMFILISAGFIGWRKMKSGYLRWNGERRMRNATESIAKGDYRHAMLDLRAAFDAEPMNPAITRKMAVTLEAAGSPAAAAQWRSRLDFLVPDDQPNCLAWACDSVKAGDLAAAERILAMLQPEPKEDATYHAAAATVAMAKRDHAGAERHWAEASRLEPKEDQYKVKLAALRLGSKEGGVHADAVRMLTEFSTGSEVGAEPLRALLADASNYRDWWRAFEYADALVAIPNALFSDKLARLSTLRAMNSRDAAGYLSELRNAALSDPGDLYLLFMWMNQHDLAMMVSEWSRTLPRDLVGAPPVCVAVADAYARSAEWQKLREFLDDGAWADADYLRRAFLARALDRLDDAETGAQEWKAGLAAARSRGDALGRLERMIRLAIGWGWEQRVQEVMWSIAGAPSCPRWMLDALWLIAMETPHASFYPRLDPKKALRDSFAATIAKKEKQGVVTIAE